MSLSETQVVDKIEVVEDGVVQVRVANRVLKNGEVIAQGYERFTVAPGRATQDMDARVVAICAAVHTPDVIAAYEAEQARIAAEMEARAQAAAQASA